MYIGGDKVTVSDKVRALLSLEGKKNSELAKYLGISPQAMNTKLYRGSFSASDLIKVADFLQCELAFTTPSGQKISLDMTDLNNDTKKDA